LRRWARPARLQLENKFFEVIGGGNRVYIVHLSMTDITQRLTTDDVIKLNFDLVVRNTSDSLHATVMQPGIPGNYNDIFLTTSRP